MKALCVFLTVFITAIFPGSPKVLTTIKPIAFIVNAITVGVGEPAVLLDPQKSPHHHHLSPGELKKLAQADVVFWVGPPLESFLKNFFEQEIGRAHV